MLKVFSYGGGVQSTAALVLAAQGQIDYQTFLFCNVGADSENPKTLEYIHSVAMPYARQHGLHLEELTRLKRDGSQETVYGRLVSSSRSIPIPVRLSNGAPGNRSCTVDFKIRVCDRWLMSRGVKQVLAFERQLAMFLAHTREDDLFADTFEDLLDLARLPRPLAMVGLGISLDEFQRMRTSETEWKQNAYPLIDLRLDRQACLNIIRSAGLPVPPKSSCWFCPFHRLTVWQEMRQEDPDTFDRAVGLERMINERREALGRDRVWFTRFGKPLDQATSALPQHSLWRDENICESGYCFV